MKGRSLALATYPLLVHLALQFAPSLTQAAQSKTPKQEPAAVRVAPGPPPEIPRSVFVIPANAKEGRNPFFPQSAQAAPPPERAKDAPLDITGLQLNGITSPPKRTAMINGRTFEAGESGEVKFPNGTKRLIKCEEIKNESAVILIDGQRRELRMRFGL